MHPPPLSTPSKSKIPGWVWFLTIGGVFFIVLIYAGMFWGYKKIMSEAKGSIDKANPEFEMLHVTRSGMFKVRHKSTGKELVVRMGRGGKIVLRPLTMKASPVAPWWQLKDASVYATGGWDRAGDTGLLIEALEDLFSDHDFAIEDQRDTTLTACSAKTLQCADIRYGFVPDADNRVWYNVQVFEAP